MVDRPDRQDEPGGDLGVRQPVRDQTEDLQLPAGQPGRVGPGRRLRTAGNLANVQLPQPTPGQQRRRRGAELVEHGAAPPASARPHRSRATARPARTGRRPAPTPSRPRASRRGGRRRTPAGTRRTSRPVGRGACSQRSSSARSRSRPGSVVRGSRASASRPRLGSPVSQPSSAAAAAVGTRACRLCACSAFSHAAARSSARVRRTATYGEPGEAGQGVAGEHAVVVGVVEQGSQARLAAGPVAAQRSEAMAVGVATPARSVAELAVPAVRRDRPRARRRSRRSGRSATAARRGSRSRRATRSCSSAADARASARRSSSGPLGSPSCHSARPR